MSSKLESKPRLVKVLRYDLVIRRLTMRECQIIVKFCKKRGYVKEIEDITMGHVVEAE